MFAKVVAWFKAGGATRAFVIGVAVGAVAVTVLVNVL